VKGKPLNNRMFFYIIEGDEDMAGKFKDLNDEVYKAFLEWLKDTVAYINEMVNFAFEWLACLGVFIKKTAEKLKEKKED